jgi:hypothetical protein
MDMKKILQAVDGAKAKAEVNSSGMRKFLQVVKEAELNQPDPKYVEYAQLMAKYDMLAKEAGIDGNNNIVDVNAGASPDAIAEIGKIKARAKQLAGPNLQAWEQARQKENASSMSQAQANLPALSAQLENTASTLSPEQLEYNRLRAQLDSLDSLRDTGGQQNVFVSRDPSLDAKEAQFRDALAKMAASLKAKGIDAAAEYDAPEPGAPVAAPVDLAKKYVDETTGMSRLLSIISEGRGPLNRPTTAEAITMQHYTTPVLNVAKNTAPSMIGKYFKAVEEELNEAAERGKDRSRQLAERVSTKINELSNDTLASYKKKSGADASKADKEGDFKRGDKRFSGIVKATKKEFDNDAKKHAVSEDLEELLDLRNQVEEAIKQRLDPKCWTGKKIGNPKTKVKGGVRVNNCVPKEAVNPAQQAAIAIAKKKAGKK